MNALAVHLYLIINYINLIFNYFGNFYRIIEITQMCFVNRGDYMQVCPVCVFAQYIVDFTREHC